jgi:hypothetical protein
MSADPSGVLVEILRLTLVLVVALFLPLLLQLLLLLVMGNAFFYLVWRSGGKVGYLLELVGTPVHEFSHAIAVLITLGGVLAVKPLSDEASTGFVQPRRGNPLEGVLAGLAPLFGGLAMLWLTGRYVIPQFEVPAVALPQFDMDAMTIGSVTVEILRFLASYFEAALRGLLSLPWGEWRTYAGLYIVLSVCMGLAPSAQDLKIFRRSLPVVLLALVAVVGLVYWLGDAATWFERLQAGLLPHLVGFSAAAGMAFTLTFFGLLLFLPFLLVQSRSRRPPVAAGQKKRPRY